MQIPSIIDVEASGFSSYSYPIEVGVIRGDGARFCRLIRPYPQWTHWDKSAEALHRLSRDHLLKWGVDGRDVCLALNQFLANATVYSDGWVVDHPWLIKLYAAAEVQMSFHVRALEYVLKEAQMDIWMQTKKQIVSNFDGSRHRASTDAEIIQKTFISTLPQQYDGSSVKAVING